MGGGGEEGGREGGRRTFQVFERMPGLSGTPPCANFRSPLISITLQTGAAHAAESWQNDAGLANGAQRQRRLGCIDWHSRVSCRAFVYDGVGSGDDDGVRTGRQAPPGTARVGTPSPAAAALRLGPAQPSSSLACGHWISLDLRTLYFHTPRTNQYNRRRLGQPWLRAPLPILIAEPARAAAVRVPWILAKRRPTTILLPTCPSLQGLPGASNAAVLHASCRGS